MSITVAKTAGFCFGVNRAVNLVYELLNEGKRVVTLGPIIHNPQLVEELERRGVRIVKHPEEAPAGSTVVIRSHGVPAQVLRRVEEAGVACADATCPFVAKIHRIVARESADGRLVLIAGDKNHPEVEGIRGHCAGVSFVFKNAGELEQLAISMSTEEKKRVSIVAQTTFSLNEWRNCIKSAKKVYTNAKIFDTICSATSRRQNEAEELSSRSDLMVIIGGRQSSNTAKLRDVCQLRYHPGGNRGRTAAGTHPEGEKHRRYGGRVHACQHHKGGTIRHVRNSQQRAREGARTDP